MPTPPQDATTRRWPVYLFVGVVGLWVFAGAWYWLVSGTRSAQQDDRPRPDPAPPDPRVTFATPYRNVRPEVKYVGDAACAGCHAQISRTYHAHPMGRSAEWVGRTGPVDVHLAGVNNPAHTAAFALRAEKSGDRIWHHMTALNPPGDALPPYTVSADLAIGSGHHGRSYLTIDQGAVWQSPISWFRQGERWDVSPGFELGAASRRPVVAGCLFCHVDRVEPVPQALNRYREPLITIQPSIGCERCHGPGELHVAERSALGEVVGADYSIVNPKHLPADLKADVCRQCHLQGQARMPRRGRELFDYRPGLPWDQFVTVFVQHPDLTDARKSVGQFEQMEQSRCFAGSGGRLSCTSCHDPHAAPDLGDAPRHYRNRCLTCHDTRGCTLPAPERAAKADSCVVCHMPARDSSNISHAAVTDHRIMRRPDAGASRAKSLAAGQLPVVPYAAGPHAPAAEERDRDWAVVLGQEVGRSSPTRPAPPELWQAAQGKLEAALGRWPGDATSWMALAGAHAARGDTARSLAAARNAVAVAPDSEVALIRLAEAAAAAEDYELSETTADRLVALSPSSADHRVTRATALVCLKRWEKAEADCRAALAVHPLHPNARLILAVCRHRRGDPDGGRTELDLALGLATASPLRASMSDWYRRQTR